MRFNCTRRGEPDLSVSLLRGHVADQLVHRGKIIGLSQVGVASQGFALLAIDKNTHLRDAGNVGAQASYKRCNCEFFGQYAGAMRISEGGIKIDDYQSGIDQVDSPDLRTGPEHMGRSLAQIDIE